MKHFNFRLDAVLRYRRRLEDECKRAFAEVRRVVSEQEERLRVLANDMQQAREDLTAMGRGKLDMPALMAQRRYMLGIERRTARGRKRLADLAGPLEERRQALVEARKQTLLLEKLREKQFQAWQREADREERKALDEISQNTHSRKES